MQTFGPSQKCQKQAHPDPPISSANASPDNPVVRLYDQRNKPARLDTALFSGMIAASFLGIFLPTTGRGETRSLTDSTDGDFDVRDMPS
jgi:hypothetical protein